MAQGYSSSLNAVQPNQKVGHPWAKQYGIENCKQKWDISKEVCLTRRSYVGTGAMAKEHRFMGKVGVLTAEDSLRRAKLIFQCTFFYK